MEHENLYKRVVDAIGQLFADESVSVDKTKQDFISLRDEINVYIDSLDADVTL